MSDKKTVTIPIGLPDEYDQCAMCVGRLQNALLEMEGVLDVKMDVGSSELTLTYDPHIARFEDIEKILKSTGAALQEKYLHKTFRLKGLDCPDCALKLQNSVAKMRGVLLASANFASARLMVEYEPANTDPGRIIERIRSLGYDVVEETKSAIPEQAGHPSLLTTIRELNWQPIFTLLAAIMIAAAFILSRFAVDSWIYQSLYALAIISAGFYAFRGALYSIRSLVLDMNALMSIAVIGAIAIGEWFDAAMVMFLFSLGNSLESYTMEKTRNSVRMLLDNFPKQARIRRGDAEMMVPLEDVQIGDISIVLPGERVPADGIISAGSTSIDQSSITGESVPADKTVGDMVFAGTLNRQGAFESRVTATTEDNTLSKIIHMVEDAQTEKAPSERFTEAFGRYYTPIVILFAVLTASIPVVVFHGNFVYWLHKSLTLLVVSCPCALVISTPVSIVSAIGNAAHKGVLIKGGVHLETLAKIRVVVFDKTGTITFGQPIVTDVVAADDFSKEEVLSIAASIESRSDHPLAKAIVEKAKDLGLEFEAASNCQSLVGMGAIGELAKESYTVGNASLMKQIGMDMRPHEEIIDTLQASGHIVIAVANSTKIIGLIALSDTIRPSSLEAINELRQIGVERIIMLTGDNKQSAASVASKLGFDEFYAELLPQDKMDIVNKLMGKYNRKVAFVGDGVNDAPSLASAAVGIAMGVAGSDTALETADVALMSEDLRRIPYAVRLGKATLRIIKENTAFALFVIALLVSSAAMGWINLSLGVFGHEGSALLVIANGMRLLRFK